MTDLFAARLQMAMSLGFHIVFASIGIAMPFFMATSHWKWLRTRDPLYRSLTKAWSKGVAIFFATGAVSGTVLSFELGLLWPGFMEHAGAIIGMPFSWEGAAFFVEAIALGLFLYGWDRLPPKIHWLSGLVVGIGGVLSAFFVICANGWMNTPRGFEWVDGRAVNIDPVVAMFNPAALWQGIHMTVAAFEATGFAVAGLHAWLLLRGRHAPFHREACRIALWFGAIAAIVQPFTGDLSARHVARHQPAKLAAMENLHDTVTRPLLTVLGMKIPGALSFLAHGDFDAEVKGLDAFEHAPPARIVHASFQIMVLIGFLLAGVGAILLVRERRRARWWESRRVLTLLAGLTPLGFVALEAGWIVTEVGRQPWIIYEVMMTRDAVTPMPGLVYPMLFFTLIYLVLALLVTFLLRRHIRALPRLLGDDDA